jgi:predicted AlkP superfamily phosphohydrolase/phosphomutase
MVSVRTLFIGMDAAEPSLIDRWTNDGTMPTLAALRRVSVWGYTTNSPGLYAGSVWPSFHTGLQPGGHGRYFFRQLVPGTYRTAPFLIQGLTVPPFWSALDAAGLRVAVIDLPKAPVVGLERGIQLADWGVHDPEGPPRSTPERLAGEMIDRHGPDPVGPCGRAVRRGTSLAEFRDRLIARIERKVAIVNDLLHRGPWDLVATVFADSHCAGHHFWALHDPTHPQHDPALLGRLGGDPLRAVYAAIDAAIARILDRIGPETTVVVLASHGMGPHYGATVMLDRILRRLEPSLRERVSPPPPRGPASPGHGGTSTPDALRAAWRRMPVSVRTALAPVSGWLYGTWEARDRSRRTCFQVPTNASGAGIRVNLVGREPRGLVARGREYDRLCDRLASDLREIINVETGSVIVDDILRTDRVFSGPQAGALPDLLVLWNRTFPIRMVRSPKIGTIASGHREIRTGDHRNGGMFFARGPGVSPGRRLDPTNETDFAPTFARLLGCILGDVDGTVIGDLCPPSRDGNVRTLPQHS